MATATLGKETLDAQAVATLVGVTFGYGANLVDTPPELEPILIEWLSVEAECAELYAAMCKGRSLPTDRLRRHELRERSACLLLTICHYLETAGPVRYRVGDHVLTRTRSGYCNDVGVQVDPAFSLLPSLPSPSSNT